MSKKLKHEEYEQYSEDTVQQRCFFLFAVKESCFFSSVVKGMKGLLLKVEFEFPIRLIRVSGSLVDGSRDVEIEEEEVEDEESQEEVCFLCLIVNAC